VSLDVPPDLLTQAERGEVDEQASLDCVRTSLPYAWNLITSLADTVALDGHTFAANNVPPPDEQSRGQLSRALASDSIRTALQQHFGVRLAFQNCHRVAAFAPVPGAAEAHLRFTTPRAQILNQSPELRDC
jgi:hypothetical protein